MNNAHAGDKVQTTCQIINRTAYYAQKGKPGVTTVSIADGTVMVAACDELGGNIYVRDTDSQNNPVLVALAEGEWMLVA